VRLTNVTSSGNGGRGIRVRDSAQVAAHGVVADGNHGGGVVVAAGRLDVDGASEIDANLGGSPVAFGAKVAPGATLTLTGTQATPIKVNGNAGLGLLLLGNFSGSFVEIAANGIQGAWVSTVDTPAFGVGNTLFAACDFHDNGASPGPYPPGGLTVLRTRTTTASAAERVQLTYDGTSGFVASQVHDNLGDGVTLGGSPVPATGLCAILPAGLACGAVDAIVEDVVVSGNEQGIVVQELDAGTSGTVPLLFGNTIKGNASAGLHVSTSFVFPDPMNGLSISGNLVGHNGFADATCTSAESASQVIFEGPVAATAAHASECAAEGTVVGCNGQLACAWNPYLSSGNCQPAYPFDSFACGTYEVNKVTGYCRSCAGNPDLQVGVLAFGGAWVNVSNTSWMVSSPQEGLDWEALGPQSFVSTAGLVCPGTNLCP
jgi:hypothetical protein